MTVKATNPKTKRSTVKKPAPAKRKSPPRDNGNHPGGRPSNYLPEYADQAYRMCLLLNATDKQLAEVFEVSEVTLNAWKKAHPEFLKSIKEGKLIADSRVAEGLFKRAVGMTLPDVHIGMHKGRPVVTEIVKHLPPDVKAAQVWLQNRAGKDWNKNPDLGGSGVLGIIINENPKSEGKAA
jgi:hypothetical protein